MSEWKEYTLGEICSLITDGKHGNCNDELCSGYYFLSAKDVYDGKLHYENARQITRLDFEETDRRTNLQPGNLLITNSGTIGRIALTLDIPETRRTTFQKSVAILKPISDYLHERFFYYSIQGNCAGLIELAEGTTQQNLLLGELRKFTIKVPSLPEQRAIASVLSSLDDKIDLLHRQNKTLEAMAETLFRQWFVEEADEEWEEKPLSSIAYFLNGLACQKYPPQNEIDKLPVLKIRELRNGFSKDSDYATTEVKPKYLVENGDIIFSWSASLMVKMWDGEKCILNQHLFKVTSKNYPKWFYHQWCKHHLAEFISISASHATTMGHIKRGDLDVAMVLVPSNEELEKMTNSMKPLVDKLIENSKQIHTLEKLRDTLLPKLMSGEVRVILEQQEAGV